MSDTDFRSFIKSKTYQKLVDDLGWNVEHVRVMANRNYISRSKWPDLLLMYPTLGMSDLIAWEDKYLKDKAFDASKLPE